MLTGKEVGKKPFIISGLVEFGFFERFHFLFYKRSIQAPGMFYTERVHCIMFKLPGDDILASFIAFNEPSDESNRRLLK